MNDESDSTKRAGADACSAENAQSALIDDLSKSWMCASRHSRKGVHVRTSGGALLVGVDAAELAYAPSAAPFSTPGVIHLQRLTRTQSNLEPFLLAGELKACCKFAIKIFLRWRKRWRIRRRAG